MARKKSAPRKRRPKAPKDEQVNGVLVRLDPGAKPGDRDMSVAALGDVKETEILTLLGLARRVTENQLGIGGG